MENKYDYDKYGKKGQRVGQAVHDLMNQENVYVPTAEEIAEERAQQYVRDLQEAADLGSKEFESPFYIVYMFNKEPWSALVNRGRFVRRQTEPIPENMVTMFPYFNKDVYKVDVKAGSIDYLWTLPSLETFKQILSHKEHYDEKLVTWVENALEEKDYYSD